MFRLLKRPVGRSMHSFRPTFELLEERRLMSLVSAGPNNIPGPIIPNVQVETVFYGSVWNDAQPTYYQNTNSFELIQEAVEIDKFFSSITNSPYMDGLSQYTGNNGTPGRGQFLGSYFDKTTLSPNLTANPPSSQLTLIQEKTITDSLQNDITNNLIPKPDGNKLYVVFLPPGTYDARDLGTGFAHHDSVAFGSGRIYYAVISHPLAWGNSPADTTLQNLTWVASHEMVEAITDPVLGQSWIQRSLPSDTSGPEIADIAGSREANNGWLGLDYGYAVMKFWSEHDQTDIPNIGFQPLTDVPLVFHGGTQFTLYSAEGTFTLQFSYQDDDAFTPGAGYLGNDTFTGLWGNESVHGTLFIDRTRILVAVFGDSDGSLIFNGTISAPDGNWSDSALEISGPINVNGQQVYAFGVQGFLSFSPGGGGNGGGGSFNPGKHPPIVPARAL